MVPQASKEASYRLVDLVYPLILECFTPQVSATMIQTRLRNNEMQPTDQQAITTLDADGINLWLAALRSSPSLPSQPHKYYELLEKLVSMLSHNFDLLGSVTNLLESYFISNAAYVLQVRITVPVFRGFTRCN